MTVKFYLVVLSVVKDLRLARTPGNEANLPLGWVNKHDKHNGSSWVKLKCYNYYVDTRGRDWKVQGSRHDVIDIPHVTGITKGWLRSVETYGKFARSLVSWSCVWKEKDWKLETRTSRVVVWMNTLKRAQNVKIFISYGNIHQEAFTVEELLNNQNYKMIQSVDISQPLHPCVGLMVII